MGSSRNYAQTTAAPTTTDAEVLAANVNRCALILFNTGAVALLIGIGTSTITIAAGNHLAFTDDDAPMNGIMAKAASGTGSMTIWEA
jgi:hypothetical protein